MPTMYLELTEEMMDKIKEDAINTIELNDIDINLDNYELDVEYTVKVDITNIKLSKKEPYTPRKIAT